MLIALVKRDALSPISIASFSPKKQKNRTKNID